MSTQASATKDRGMPRVAVIGAGPAGMMAAITAAGRGAGVTVYEKNPFAGKKLRITGKGRCNVTNDCTPREVLDAVRRNPKFLYSAVYRFGPSDVMSFFEEAGVPLKTERGRRVFPVSDKAADIQQALVRKMTLSGVKVRYNTRVDSIYRDDGTWVVCSGSGKSTADAVIIATGGVSYPGTGSTGDGFRMLKRLGIRITELKPSLVPVNTAEDFAGLSGLTLKNVTLSVFHGEKCVFRELGEMLFTHFGVSGPLVLSASANMQDYPVAEYTMKVDLKPGLDREDLDARIIRDLSKYSAKDFVNSLSDLLPQKLIQYIVGVTGIDPRKKSRDISRAERGTLCEALSGFDITPVSFRPVDEAIITRGGAEVDQIDPKNMEVHGFPGLFVCGEMLDTDAYTGGFNLQIAFSTGRSAGEGASDIMRKVKKTKKETKVDFTKIRVAIDGPSGAGKSTIAKQVAQKTGLIYVDTGSLYRAVGLYMARNSIDAYDEEKIVSELKNVDIRLEYSEGKQHVILNGECVDGMIRTEEVSYYASAVSKIPKVREFLMNLQKSLGDAGGVIMDGRDIGTVIIPDAEVKIFLVADAEERARRRYAEQLEKGQDVTFDEVLKSIIARDEQDSSRDVAPLKPAEDAVTLVNNRTIEDAVNFVIDLMKEKAQ